jgi:hypothetical protein
LEEWDCGWKEGFSSFNDFEAGVCLIGSMVLTRDLGGATPIVLCGTVEKKKIFIEKIHFKYYLIFKIFDFIDFTVTVSIKHSC